MARDFLSGYAPRDEDTAAAAARRYAVRWHLIASRHDHDSNCRSLPQRAAVIG